VRQWLIALDLNLRPDLPRLAEMIAIKSAKCADRLIERGARKLAIALQVDEEVEDLP